MALTVGKTAADDVAQGIETLYKLGTAQAVANLLADLGMQGRPRNGQRCPVSRYLKALAGDDALVLVGSETVTVVDTSGHTPECAHRVDGCLCWMTGLPKVSFMLPTHVIMFILQFDSGMHPALVQRVEPRGHVSYTPVDGKWAITTTTFTAADMPSWAKVDA